MFKIIKFTICVFLILFVLGLADNARAATPVYYSVGQNTTDHSSGGDVSITSGAATFTVAQTAVNLGVGDRLTAGGNVYYLASKTDTTHWDVVTATGATPSDLGSTAVTSIAHEYTSLSAAIAGATDANHINNTDLTLATGADVVLNIPCYYDTGADTTAVTVDGYTTGADNYIKIYTPNNTSTECNTNQRHSGKALDELGNYTGYAMKAPAHWSDMIVDSVGYTHIEGIIIDGDNYAFTGIIANTDYATTYVDSCIVFNSTHTSTNGFTNGGTGNTILKVSNSIVYDLGGNGFGQWSFQPQYLFNVTVVNCGIGFNFSTYGNAVIKNSIASGNGTDYSGTVDSSSTNNLSSDDTAPGSNAIINATVTFSDAANDDFHLASTDTAAKDAGTDLSSDANLPFTDDIDGETRANHAWDIGADEAAEAIYRSVGPSATAALQDDNSHADTITITSGTATFSSALADNIGVGDVILYDSDSSDTLTSADSIAFIKSRTDSTHYTLQTQTGAEPADLLANDTWAIYRAYTSLANAEAGTVNATLSALGITYTGGNRDLVANNEQWNIACYANGTTADQTAVTIQDWTTGANNYIKIYTPTETTEVGTSQRHSGKWDEGKYRLESLSGIAISVYDNNVVIDGLLVKGVGGTTSVLSGLYAVYAATNYLKISNCIFDANLMTDGVAVSVPNVADYFENCYFWNNIVYGASGAAGIWLRGVEISAGSGKTVYLYNNTVYGFPRNYWVYNGTVIAKNNISQGSTQESYHGTFDASSDYNIASDATAPNATFSGNNLTVSFADANNDDFHLASTDTSAKDAGTDLSSDSNLSFSDDVDGDTRPVNAVWDIGADEELSSAFTLTSSSGLENATPVNIELTLSSTYSSNITITYTLGGTAIGSGTDYTDTLNGTGTIISGQTTANLPFTIINDDLDEDNETIILTLASVSAGIMGTNTTHTYTITDNDTAGITTTESSSSTSVAEGGTTDSYTIVLDSEPTNDVTITLTPDSQISLSPTTSLTFTNLNWNIPQAITVSAIDDSIVEESYLAVIAHFASSSDTNYNNISIVDVTATVTDNDINPGGGGAPGAFNPPIPPKPGSSPENPEGGFKIIINPQITAQGKILSQEETINPVIMLKLFKGPDTNRMAIAINNPIFKYVNLVPFQEETIIDLSTYNSSSNLYTIYVKFYNKTGYSSEIVSKTIKLVSQQETENKDKKPQSTEKKLNIFAYNQPRLSSLSKEQNIAKELKKELEEYYGENKIPVVRKHWSTIVNSYIYGFYPVNAIIKAIKHGGKTVHPIIPFSAWQRAKDYLEWIGR